MSMKNSSDTIGNRNRDNETGNTKTLGGNSGPVTFGIVPGPPW